MEEMAKSTARMWRIIAWLAVLVFLAIGGWWYFRIPSPGKGGLLMAVGATLMPFFWEKVSVVGKMFWIGMLFLLMAVEYRAIDSDRIQAAQDQQKALQTIGNGFQNVLTAQQQSFSTLISQSQTNFDALLRNERNDFNRMMANNIQSQQRESATFSALLKRADDLLTSQEELYAFASGTLLPATDPTPTICNPIAPDEFLVQMGDTVYTTNTLPFNVLTISGTNIISIDKSQTGALLVSINLNASEGRIIARISKNNATINPASGLIVTRDKSTLLLQDQYGKDIINARYLNERAFRITGIVPYQKGSIALPLPFLHGCIRMRNSLGPVTAVNIN